MREHGLTLDAPISNRFQSPQIVLKPQSYKRAGLFKSKAVHHVGRSGRDAGWIAGYILHFICRVPCILLLALCFGEKKGRP